MDKDRGSEEEKGGVRGVWVWVTQTQGPEGTEVETRRKESERDARETET